MSSDSEAKKKLSTLFLKFSVNTSIFLISELNTWLPTIGQILCSVSNCLNVRQAWNESVPG